MLSGTGVFIPDLKDLYSPAVSQLSLPLARLVCQRTNAWWDSAPRKRYCTGLKMLLWFLIIFVFALAIHCGMTIDLFVLTVVAPQRARIIEHIRGNRRKSVTAFNFHLVSN